MAFYVGLSLYVEHNYAGLIDFCYASTLLSSFSLRFDEIFDRIINAWPSRIKMKGWGKLVPPWLFDLANEANREHTVAYGMSR